MTLPEIPRPTSRSGEPFPAPWVVGVANDLRQLFDVDFTLFDGNTGDVLHASDEQPRGDELLRAELARAVAGRDAPQFLGDEDGVLILALPLPFDQDTGCVAVAAFVTRSIDDGDNVAGAADLLGFDETSAAAWINRQPLWTAHALLRLGAAAVAKLAADANSKRAQADVEKIADNLAATYEEISLLYGVTQNLRISSSDEDTGRFALQSLIGVLAAKGVAMQLLPVAEPGKATYKARTESLLISEGDCPLNDDQLSRLIQHLNLAAGAGPLVANVNVTSDPSWPFPEVQQVIVVPMAEGSNLFGWLVAFNHRTGKEFNSMEASLLASVGVMLGIHSGNRELYRRQAEFLASVVRALTSAIDAKDPYTCGHSDRVARIAVRLAKELGHDAEFLNTIYMAGLLHDVGKIGIQESVLRKPGALTPEEFEHIKLHPELGYRIIADIQQLADVLPAVLHHHEQWDGHGYPHRLAGTNIPEIARIMAVADAYDAMFSSRPYRPGLPEEKVEEILRDGAGQHWDAKVIDAYFAARDDIREFGRNERANLTLDVQQWTS